MNIHNIRKVGKGKLEKYCVDDAIYKVDILLGYLLKMSKIELIINENKEVEQGIINIFEKYIDEIIAGKPIQYIIGFQEFMKLKFEVNEDVLIPQPDTEILVEELINKVKKIDNYENNKIKILDLCTGSGAIAISIEHYLEDTNLNIYASDISNEALEVAKKNAKVINKNTKINFVLSDMFEHIKENNFDFIISNPPYISTDTIKTLSKEVQSEPHIALDGGKDGLEFYRIITSEAYKFLKRDGCILIEIGYDQKNKVIDLFNNSSKYYNIKCLKDLSGNDRVIEAYKN